MAAAALRRRGIKEFDMEVARPAWDRVLFGLADDLAGTAYPRPLLERIWKVAHGTRWQRPVASKASGATFNLTPAPVRRRR